MIVKLVGENNNIDSQIHYIECEEIHISYEGEIIYIHTNDDTPFIIAKGIENYNVAYIMNEDGKTVDTIKAQ